MTNNGPHFVAVVGGAISGSVAAEILQIMESGW